MIKEKKDNFVSFEKSLFCIGIFNKPYILDSFAASDKKLERESFFW